MAYFEKHPLLLLIIGVLGASLSSTFVKLSTAPSAVTAALRLLWTVALMTPVVAGRGEIRRELLAAPKKLVLLSFLSGLFLAIHFACWFESLQHTSVASSASIVCTEVIWVSLGFCLFLKGKLTWKAVGAIAVTLGGNLLIAWSDSGSGGQLYGDMLALLAAIATAVYTLIGRFVREKLSTTVYTYLVYCACAAVLTATTLVQGHSMAGFGLSPVIAGLLLAVFSTILGHSIFSWCLKYFSPAFVSASKLSEPVVAAAFAALLFSEIPTLTQVLGGVLTLGGVLYYSKLSEK